MTTKLERLEKEQENLAPLDGGDMIGVMVLIAIDKDLDLSEFLETDLATELIYATQSNPEQAMATLTQWAYLEEKIAELS
jgi:hypothetical protein